MPALIAARCEFYHNDDRPADAISIPSTRRLFCCVPSLSSSFINCLSKQKTMFFSKRLLAILTMLPVLTLAEIVDSPIQALVPGETKQTEAISEIIEKAKQALAKKDIEEARAILQPLSVQPDLSHPEIILADIFSSSGYRQDARNILDKLSVTAPQRLDLYFAYVEMAIQEQRWFDGWVLSNLAQRLTPPKNWTPAFADSAVTGLYKRNALCCEGRGDWTGAKRVYEQLIPKNKDDRSLLVGLGRSNFHLGNIEEARKQFIELKSVEPTAATPELLLAQLFESTGKATEAEAAYRKAVTDGSGIDAENARLSLARWLIANNRPGDAEKVLSESKADFADLATEQQFVKALAARMSGKTDSAKQILTQLHQKNPAALPISNQLALVLIQGEDEGLRARALQLAESNVRNNPNVAEAWATLGWVQFSLGDAKSAEQSLSKAAEAGTVTRDTLYYLMELKRAAGDTQAVELLKKAYESTLGPNYFAWQAK